MTQNDAPNNLGNTQSMDQDQPENKMEKLLNEEGLNIELPKQGETRNGVIASISEGQILVSIGAKSEGIITGKEFEAIPEDVLSTLAVGTELPVFVLNPEDQNGNLVLSYIRAVEEQSWVDAETYMKEETTFTSKIIGYNKGGLLVPLDTIRGFVPASQVSLSRRMNITGETPEDKYKEMIGEEVDVRVIEVDRERRRLILSERAASSETRDQIKDMLLDDLNEGETRIGKVTSLADFGAFVNINGADGLVHLSEISWEHINHPNEVLTVGQEVKVKIISVDKDRRRIGLSLRQLQDDPWTDQITELKEGQLVEAEVTRLTSFGAFAKLRTDNKANELEGLIHISEISDHRIEHPKEVIHVGDIITLRIINIEKDVHRIGLSIRRVDSPAYADQDWQTLSKEFDLNPTDDEGEMISDIIDPESAEPAEQPKETEEAEAPAVVKEEAPEVTEAPESAELAGQLKEAETPVVAEVETPEAPAIVEEEAPEVTEAPEEENTPAATDANEA